MDLRILRRVRMLRTSVNFELFVDSPTEFVLGDHSPNGLFNDLFRLLLQEILESFRLQSSRVERVRIVLFLKRFISRHLDFFSVDDDDKISGVHMRSELGAILPRSRSRIRGSRPDLPWAVDQPPLPLRFSFFLDNTSSSVTFSI